MKGELRMRKRKELALLLSYRTNFRRRSACLRNPLPYATHHACPILLLLLNA